MSARHASVVATALLAAGCYDVPMPACGFRCDYGASEVDGAQCPSGYFCNTDSRCHRSSPPHLEECPGDPTTDIDFIRPTIDLTAFQPLPDDPAYPFNDIRFGFSEPVIVNFDDVTVVDGGGAVQSGTVVQVGSQEWSWFPDGGFVSAQRYQVTLSRDITDLAGNRMLEPFVYSFTAAFDDVPPQLLAPTFFQTGVLPTIRLAFTEPVQAIDGVTVTQNGRAFAYETTATGVAEYQLTLREQLLPNVPYTLSAGPPIADYSGNLLVPYSGTFNPGTDTIGPKFFSKMPEDGETVDVDTIVVVQFDENVVGISESTFTLSMGGGPPIDTTVTYVGTTRTARIFPRLQLVPQQAYIVEVASTVADLSGNTFASFPANFIFNTGNDSVAPSLTAVPAQGSTNVDPASPITIAFDEPVTGVSATSFVVTDAGPGAITDVNGDGVEWRFTPDAPIPANTTVTVQLTSAIRDLSNNAFAPTGYTYVFTTAP